MLQLRRSTAKGVERRYETEPYGTEPFGSIGAAVRSTESVGMARTVSVKPVVFPRSEPETVIGYEPGVAPAPTESERELASPPFFGLTGFLLKEAETPEGRPETESVTFCFAPFVSVAVIVVIPDCPCVTVRLPEFESV